MGLRVETRIGSFECGSTGLIGAGSMKAELLPEHIRKTRSATPQSFRRQHSFLEAIGRTYQCRDRREGQHRFTSWEIHPKSFQDSRQLEQYHPFDCFRQACSKALEAGADAVLRKV